MTDPADIDPLVAAAGPIIGAQRARLGAERLTAFIEAHGKLQAMLMFLTMSVHTVPTLEYRDAALACMRQDAKDLRKAAGELARFVEELADHWQAQREENTP